MRSMRGINRLAVEKYWCPDCEQERSLDDVASEWKCPECGERIHVRAMSSDGNERIVIVRMRASELQEDDLLLMPGQLDGKSYRVLGVNEVNNRLGIGLSSWGRYMVDKEEPVNCRIGTWTEN